jgi:hypothetical protein
VGLFAIGDLSVTGQGARPSLSDFRGAGKGEEWVPVLGASKVVNTLRYLDNLAFCLAAFESLSPSPLVFAHIIAPLASIGMGRFAVRFAKSVPDSSLAIRLSPSAG